MPENRNAAHHRDRVVEALKDEITTILEGELADPRIGLCTVKEVILAPGGRAARVLVQVDGDETEGDETIQGLSAARAFIRAEVRVRLGKRHVPELTFHLDRSEQVQSRIDELLGRVGKRRSRKK